MDEFTVIWFFIMFCIVFTLSTFVGVIINIIKKPKAKVIKTMPISNKTNNSNLVTGALVSAALLGMAAWKVEGVVLDRNIKRNRAKITNRRANGLYW